MYDPIDSYLSRTLKNWTAQQQPPVNGRARLLLLAAAAPVIENKAMESSLSRADHDGHFVPLASSRTPVEQTFQPLRQPRLWMMHMSLTPFHQVT
jgi:hypothetical protein